MPDKFAKQFSTIDGPATDGFAITPSDVTVFSQPTRAIYVGVSGTLTVQMAASTNTVLSFLNVSAGVPIPIRVTKVFANTTATSVIGLF